ncbi:MAG TPA: hypothetical protein VF613_22920 [Longimicrobium sp.]|jgi:hypothetical protein
MTQSERQALDQLAASSDNDFTAADRDALVAARLPIICLLKAAARLAACGPTDPDCLAKFVDEVRGCFGG